MKKKEKIEDFDEVIYVCPKCHGEGGGEYEDFQGGIRRVYCALCNGSGFIDWVTRAICGKRFTVLDEIMMRRR
jgi:hypothetical protein